MQLVHLGATNAAKHHFPSNLPSTQQHITCKNQIHHTGMAKMEDLCQKQEGDKLHLVISLDI